jgi:two-component system, OmpR family, response regulator RegX3
VFEGRIRAAVALDGSEHAPTALRSEWPRVLVIAAEGSYRQILTRHLASEGFQVETASNVREGLEVHKCMRLDLALLDAVPGYSGIELSQAVQSLAPTPLIIVSASNSEADVVRSLEIGAADYVLKPFRVRELIARMRAILRRIKLWCPPVEVLTHGPVTLDSRSCEVYVHGKAITLPRREFELLHFFMTHVGQVVTREMCIDRVWRGKGSDSRTLDTHVKRIRTKIEPDPAHPLYLTTFRGVGYGFNADPREEV